MKLFDISCKREEVRVLTKWIKNEKERLEKEINTKGAVVDLATYKTRREIVSNFEKIMIDVGMVYAMMIQADMIEIDLVLSIDLVLTLSKAIDSQIEIIERTYHTVNTEELEEISHELDVVAELERKLLEVVPMSDIESRLSELERKQ